MTVESWILSVFAAILLVLLGWLSRWQLRSWLAPSAFFNLYWGVLLLTPLVLAPDFYFWPGAALLIFFFGLTLHMGVQFGWAFAGINVLTKKRRTEPGTYKILWGKVALIFCTAIGLISVLITLQSRGYSPDAVLQPEMISQISRDFSLGRYNELYNPPLIARLLTTFVTLGGIFSGVWLAISHGKRWLALLPFVPAGLLTLILTTRASLIFPLIFCLAAYCATLVLKQITIRIWSTKQFIFLGLLMIVAFGIFVGTQMLRERLALNTISVALNKAKVSFLGSPSAFSQWLEHDGLNRHELGWGRYNLAGLFDFLGIATRQMGIYEHSIPLGKGQITTNVYTVFRQLIEDFTLVGAIVFIFCLGIAAGIAYRKVSTGASSWIPLLATFYAYTLGSYLTSIFNYNTNILAWLIFYLCLSLIGLRLLRRIST
jgi:oligosaccharide repeat unit polymerase